MNALVGVEWIARVLRPRVVALVAVLLGLPLAAAVAADAPLLERSVLPATGQQQTILTIGTFGRYALEAHSAQGTGLELVDRMSGPGGMEGEPGATDGRVDAFLDRGEYKLLLTSSETGSGEVTLEASPFAELNEPEIPRLQPMKLVAATLDDIQQRSYWLDMPEGGVVAIEAAGRNLADLRLWQDGNWLVDAEPTATTLQPEAGRPLASLQLVARLSPGLYLLTAYGGPAVPWSKAGEEHPFYIRLGFPQLAAAGRQAFIASPLGVDRFLVPASANYFRLELPQAEAAQIAVGDYAEDSPFTEDRAASITKETLPPVAALLEYSGEGWKLVTIRRDAGKPYVLQHFFTAPAYQFETSGSYWLSTIHSGAGQDSVDATVVFTRRSTTASAGEPERIIRSTAPQLDPTVRWQRRFNLLEEATILFEVLQPGAYRVEGSGADAEYRFALLVNAPPGAEVPPLQPSGHAWQLERGYYQLHVRPKENGKGIITLTVSGARAVAGSTDTTAQTAVTWPEIALEKGQRYTVYINEQPGVTSGIVLRRLPVDLAAGLPVTLAAGQSIDVRVTTPGDGTVTAIAEDGTAVPFAIDGGAALTSWLSTSGEHRLSLRNAGDLPATIALRFTPAALAPDTPLPALSDEARERIVQFDALVPGEPRFLDFGRSEARSFAFSVAEPALYRLETTGLLQTEGTLRTRTITALDRQGSNGVGRNFLVQQYLGQGDYQSTVAVQGETRGHLGLQLTRTAVAEGGALTLGVPARRTLAAGEGLAYGFTIAERGVYRLRSLGLDRSFTMRLEDAEGWPLLPPGGEADVGSEFAPGDYRMVILPQPVEAKVVTLLEALPDPAPRLGHGPHALAVGATANFRWLEPAAGEARVPDQWDFAIAAPLRTTIELSAGMRGALLRLAPDETVMVAEVLGGATWQGELVAGRYRVEVRSAYPNNQLDYWIALSAEELAAGLSRAITAPADLLVSVGADTVVEIGSFGDRDVRAWLYDAAGALVATNDDRANDWNFAIAGRFAPGRYKLHVEPVGAESAEINISVSESRDIAGPALRVGEDVSVSGAGVHLLPLALPGTGDLLILAATAGGAVVGMTLEQQGDDGWHAIDEDVGTAPWLAVPLPDDATYRLRTWLADRMDGAITIQSRRVSPPAGNAARWLGSGASFVAVEGIAPPLSLAAVALDRPGTFRLRAPQAGLRWSSETGVALANDPLALVFASGTKVWLATRGSVDSPIVAEQLDVDERGVQVVIPAGRVLQLFDAAAPGADAAVLWLAESRVGQPGLGTGGPRGGDRWLRRAEAVGAALIDAGVAAGQEVALASAQIPMAVADQAAVVVEENPLPSSAVWLWNAGAGGGSLPMTLRRFTYRPPAVEALEWGAFDIALDARGAHAYTLPAGAKRLRLVLPPGMAALLTEGGTPELLWSGSRGRVVLLDTMAARLLLLPTAAIGQRFGVSVGRLDGGEPMPELGRGSLFKQHFAAAGIVRLHVEEPPTSAFDKAPALRVLGAAQSVTLVAADGSVRRGDGAAVSGGGTLEIAHGPGLVVAWVEGDVLPWLTADATAVVAENGAVLPLSGASQRLRFTATEPRFLHVKTTAPVIAAFTTGPQKGKIQVFPTGADLSALLPAGTTDLALQSAAAGDLGGTAALTTTAVEPIGEGLGPTTRLAPGDARLFSFTVTDERDVGVGVRGSADVAVCRLLDADGRLLGEGVVQMHRLRPGTYLLAVEAPATGEAVELQPVLVGAATPDPGPPEEVKRLYLELAGLKPKS